MGDGIYIHPVMMDGGAATEQDYVMMWMLEDEASQDISLHEDNPLGLLTLLKKGELLFLTLQWGS